MTNINRDLSRMRLFAGTGFRRYLIAPSRVVKADMHPFVKAMPCARMVGMSNSGEVTSVYFSIGEQVSAGYTAKGERIEDPILFLSDILGHTCAVMSLSGLRAELRNSISQT